ncbi:MAG TPA: GGDEF domain-containing protein [Candidatus Baltobacteraceae bacterium]|nr:GGDEF domain-containing protein [Candidatus Baltobacteraceae bacterium]
MRDQLLVWNTDSTLRVTSLTARLRGFAELDRYADALNVSDLWGSTDPFPLQAHLRALSGETVVFESLIRGIRYAFQLAPLFAPNGSVSGVTGRAIELAETGALLSIEERLRAALASCERTGRHAAVLFIDLDDFKAINETRGHDYGDRVLSAVAERLQRYVRVSDTVVRTGGDEFAIVIEDLGCHEAATDAARKILRSLDEPLPVDDERLRVCASIGGATYPGPWSSPAALLAAAEREMRAVKKNGGNGIKLASPWQAHSSAANTHFAILESA